MACLDHWADQSLRGLHKQECSIIYSLGFICVLDFCDCGEFS